MSIDAHRHGNRPLCDKIDSELVASQQRIATLESALVDAQRELRIAQLKGHQFHDFCPDHRDKQRNKSCLACQNDALRARLDDYENAMKGALNPHSDEVHCSCVPLLHARIATLDVALAIVCAHLCQTTWETGKERLHSQTCRDAHAALDTQEGK